MASNLQMTFKRHNGGDIDTLLPTTVVEQITVAAGAVVDGANAGDSLATILNARLLESEKGSANGVATLGSDQKLTASQVPSYLMAGGNYYAGSFNTAFNLSTFYTALTTGLGDADVTTRYGWFYQCTTAADVSWSNGTPAFVAYVVTPGDEGDTASPISLEAGDLLVFTKYEYVDPNGVYTFAVINNSTAQASTSALGTVMLSSATVTTSMNGSSKVITEDVLYDVIGTSAGKIAAGDHTHSGVYQPLDTELTALAGLAVTDGNFIVGNGSTWVVESGGTARTSLGLAIGTDVQAYDAGLASIAGLTTSADKMIYTTAADTYAVIPLTAAGRALLDDSDASAQRTTLGLAIGTNVQAWDADLDTIAGLTKTDGNFIVANGTAWTVESGATARASLGLVIGTDVQAQSAALSQIAGLAYTDGNFIVGNGGAWVVESGATARTSLGVYSTTEVDNLFTNRPEIFYDTTTGAGSGDLIIDLD